MPPTINADAIHGYDDVGTKAYLGGERNEGHCATLIDLGILHSIKVKAGDKITFSYNAKN